ncbi:MAG: hypothetical protein M0Z71_00180 [Nitrospiraceae bacterium]|nr:hypothetical protein [Nitrospiraceae bacterium]
MTQHGTSEYIFYMTENEVRIKGIVKEVSVYEESVALIVHTNTKHNGRRYPKDHVVRVRRDNRAYRAAKMSRSGDVVWVKGAIHQDNSIVPMLFENQEFYKDDRYRLLKNLPEAEMLAPTAAHSN